MYSLVMPKVCTHRLGAHIEYHHIYTNSHMFLPTGSRRYTRGGELHNLYTQILHTVVNRMYTEPHNVEKSGHGGAQSDFLSLNRSQAT